MADFMRYVLNHFQLLLSLFRIIEPATGTICIDGVDVTKIGLQDRTSVTLLFIDWY